MLTNTPENITVLREKIGLTQKQCAELFGVSLRSWQRREASGTVKDIKTSKIEFEYLLLLADEHPEFVLVRKGQ